MGCDLLLKYPESSASKISPEKSTSKSGYFWKESVIGLLIFRLGFQHDICNRPVPRIISLPDMLSYFLIPNSDYNNMKRITQKLIHPFHSFWYDHSSWFDN
jgi:hypothetical protein